MKTMRGFIIVIIMIVLAAGIAGARGPYTPEEATRAFVEGAIAGDIERMSYAMTEDAAALLILYGDANRIRSFFSSKGGITRIEQVSNDGNIAITRVTFRDGSTEQFRLFNARYDWVIMSQIIRRN